MFENGYGGACESEVVVAYAATVWEVETSTSVVVLRSITTDHMDTRELIREACGLPKPSCPGRVDETAKLRIRIDHDLSLERCVVIEHLGSVLTEVHPDGGRS
jgi:hypothetical protein